MSKSNFIHTLLESKITFASEQKAIILLFFKNVAFLFGHPADEMNIIDNHSG